jgi:hypothetical protein
LLRAYGISGRHVSRIVHRIGCTLRLSRTPADQIDAGNRQLTKVNEAGASIDELAEQFSLSRLYVRDIFTESTP